MESKILKFALLTIIFAGCVVLLENTGKPPDALASKQESIASSNTRKSLSKLIVSVEEVVGLPVRISIPSIKVNSAIDRVGLTPDGSIDVPKLPRNTAWFKLGPRPGEVGSATISGHVNWWNGATAVFAKLNKLKPGDKIIVRDDKGKDVSFTVKKTRIYGPKDDVSAVYNTNDDQAHLNLITCSGVWNKLTKQYSKRLVVFADRE